MALATSMTMHTQKIPTRFLNSHLYSPLIRSRKEEITNPSTLHHPKSSLVCPLTVKCTRERIPKHGIEWNSLWNCDSDVTTTVTFKRKWSLPAFNWSGVDGVSNPPMGSVESETIVGRAERVKREIIACHRLVETMGNGVVYLGSSRTPNDHPFFRNGMEISREISLMLGSTTWSGIGKGMMEAVTLGALEASSPAAGFKIQMEAMADSTSFIHPFLPPDSYIVCDSILARKQGFLFAGSRRQSSDKTAFIALPGGIGTLDEIFDILALIQLNKTEFQHSVPFLIMNYDGCYDGLLAFLDDLVPKGVLAPGEFQNLCLTFSSNFEALEYLADYYSIEVEFRTYHKRVQKLI